VGGPEILYVKASPFRAYFGHSVTLDYDLFTCYNAARFERSLKTNRSKKYITSSLSRSSVVIPLLRHNLFLRRKEGLHFEKNTIPAPEMVVVQQTADHGCAVTEASPTGFEASKSTTLTSTLTPERSPQATSGKETKNV